jgi:hypothetical protein
MTVISISRGFLTSRRHMPYFHVSMISAILPDVYDDAQPYIQFSKVVVDVFSPLASWHTRRCKPFIWRDCISMDLQHGSVVDFLHGLFSLTFMCILSIHPVLGHLRGGNYVSFACGLLSPSVTYFHILL